MFKIVGFFLKLTVFSLLVLVIGNWLRWDGITISDQIKLKMSHAEDTGLFDSVRDWADQLTHDAKRGFHKKLGQISSQEEIPSSERQKLRALIRELNSSHKKD